MQEIRDPSFTDIFLQSHIYLLSIRIPDSGSGDKVSVIRIWENQKVCQILLITAYQLKIVLPMWCAADMQLSKKVDSSQ